jgi:hypothetical protein
MFAELQFVLLNCLRYMQWAFSASFSSSACEHNSFTTPVCPSVLPRLHSTGLHQCMEWCCSAGQLYAIPFTGFVVSVLAGCRTESVDGTADKGWFSSVGVRRRTK